MMIFSQGDVIKISGYRNRFLIVSKNAFITATHVFHVCPLSAPAEAGPIHIPICGKNGFTGTAICEQLKLIDPNARSCSREDSLPYGQIMEISDVIQGLFEYD